MFICLPEGTNGYLRGCAGASVKKSTVGWPWQRCFLLGLGQQRRRKNGAIWTEFEEARGQRHAASQTRNLAIWQKREGRTSAKQKAGNRHWLVGSAQKGS